MALEGESGLEIKRIASGTDAGKVSDFLLGKDCFDDQRFTPGELEQLRYLPLKSIQDKTVQCWFQELNGDIISAIIFVENEHLSGGYRLDYFGVHRAYRKQKLGLKLMTFMLDYCKSSSGRYIETFTCDLPEYEQARRMFLNCGFQIMCHLPNYYYPGEGKLIYMKHLELS